MNVLEKSPLQETFIKSNGIVTPKTHILMYLIAYKMTLKLIIPVQNKKVKSILYSGEKSPEVIFQRSSHIFMFFFDPSLPRRGGVTPHYYMLPPRVGRVDRKKT